MASGASSRNRSERAESPGVGFAGCLRSFTGRRPELACGHTVVREAGSACPRHGDCLRDLTNRVASGTATSRLHGDEGVRPAPRRLGGPPDRESERTGPNADSPADSGYGTRRLTGKRGRWCTTIRTRSTATPPAPRLGHEGAAQEAARGGLPGVPCRLRPAPAGTAV